jgi:molybdenum cofactor sulfurtransferase
LRDQPLPMSKPASISGESSSTSEVDEHDYQTDFTTPAASESSPEDVEGDEVEDFRDREYPQLKGEHATAPIDESLTDTKLGKVYLDHGGTTV